MGFSLRNGLEPLAIVFGLAVLLNVVKAVRRLSNPVIQRSISEPVVFPARIWVHLLRGSWFGITVFDR